jgi:hypothetical protein
LIEQENGFAVRAAASPSARRLNLHERYQRVHLRLGGQELGQDAPEAQSVVAQRGSHPVIALGRQITLVEDQVDDFEHRLDTRVEIRRPRQLEGDGLIGQRAFGACDTLRDGRLGRQKGARDLVGGEPAQQAQGERNASLLREHGVAGHEHQSQEVVPHHVVGRLVEVCRL